MSSVYVNIYNIKSFKSDVESLRDNMKENFEDFCNMAITLSSKANTAVGNATKKIELMNDDIDTAGEVLNKNTKYLNGLYYDLDKIKKREAQAEEELESAMAAQTSAKNSSSGSTEEEKKAHEAAVKAANSELNAAKSYLKSIQAEKKVIEDKIYKVQQANIKLNNIIRDIQTYRNGAQDYIRNVKNYLSNFESKKKEYDSIYQKNNGDLGYLLEYINNAENYINGALNKFSDAFNTSKEGQINVRDTNVLSNTANLLRSMKRTVEVYAKKQKESMKTFMETLGDDVSVMTAKMGKQVMDECIKQTTNFDRLAEYILEAKSYLDKYVAIANSI